MLRRGGREVARAQPPPVDVVDGTAAGDAFTAALTVALLDGASDADAPAKGVRRRCPGRDKGRGPAVAAHRRRTGGRPVSAPTPPTPLIIDTDPGVDDAVAIMLALASPEVELRAVTTVFGNVPQRRTTENAGRLLALCDRSDVPVGRGAARPLVHPQRERAEAWHGGDGLGGRGRDAARTGRRAGPTRRRRADGRRAARGERAGDDRGDRPADQHRAAARGASGAGAADRPDRRDGRRAGRGQRQRRRRVQRARRPGGRAPGAHPARRPGHAGAARPDPALSGRPAWLAALDAGGPRCAAARPGDRALPHGVPRPLRHRRGRPARRGRRAGGGGARHAGDHADADPGGLRPRPGPRGHCRRLPDIVPHRCTWPSTPTPTPVLAEILARLLRLG